MRVDFVGEHITVSQRKPKSEKMCGFKLCITVLIFIWQFISEDRYFIDLCDLFPLGV